MVKQVKQVAPSKNYTEETLRFAAKGLSKKQGGLNKGDVKLAVLELYEALEDDWRVPLELQVNDKSGDVLREMLKELLESWDAKGAEEERLAGMKKIRILMLGLDAAGKTTILFNLKLGLGTELRTIPTIGFKCETVEYKNISLELWDVGGKKRIRPLWRHYYHNTRGCGGSGPPQGLIFVVASNDKDRVGEARDELHRLLSEDELREAIVLVFANPVADKEDLPNAMSVAEVTDKLGLHSLQNHKWHIQGTCATSGEGLFEGLDWLAARV